MKRWIQWAAGTALLLGVLVVATAASGLYLAEQKRNRTIDIKPRPVAYTTDAQTIERGRYLYTSRGCTECHGAQGTGREFVNDGKGTRIVGPNIMPAGGPDERPGYPPQKQRPPDSFGQRGAAAARVRRGAGDAPSAGRPCAGRTPASLLSAIINAIIFIAICA